MKKTLLVVFLAITMLLTFTAMAMAGTPTEPTYDTIAVTGGNDGTDVTKFLVDTTTAKVSNINIAVTGTGLTAGTYTLESTKGTFTAGATGTFVNDTTITFTDVEFTPTNALTPSATSSTITFDIKKDSEVATNGSFGLRCKNNVSTGSVAGTVADGKKIGKTVSGNNIVFYTDADAVDLAFTATDPKATAPAAVSAFADASGKDYTFTAEDGTAKTVYNVKYVKVTLPSFSDALYKGNTVDASDAYGKSGSSYGIPLGTTATPYVQLSSFDTTTYPGMELYINGDKITLTSTANKLRAKGAALADSKTSYTAEIKIGGTVFATKTFTLVRPTVKEVIFNDDDDTSGADEENFGTDRKLVYKVDTDDWSTVYFRVEPTVSGAKVEIDGDDQDDDWTSRRMSKSVYSYEVSVEIAGAKQEYTLVLQDEDYKGPTVKSFEASEEAKGKGDSYITVVDNENQKLYIFLPYDVEEDEVYYSVEFDDDVDTIKLSGDSIDEDEFTKIKVSDNDELTFEDDYNASYSYTIELYKSDSKSDDDEDSLKDLVIKSGTKSSNAKTVDIDFSASTTKYSVPIDKDNEYLNIKATKKDSNAYIFIENESRSSITVSDLDTSKSVSFDILVIAENCEDSTTYTVTTNGAGSGELASLSAGVALTPSFNKLVTSYTGYTAPGLTTTNIYATAKDSADYVIIAKGNTNSSGVVSSFSTLTSGKQAASYNVPLSAGNNIFRVSVSGSSTALAVSTYYLSIYVPTANPKCVVSSQTLYVNNAAKTLSAYNINGNNFLKLRDIAYLLDGTTKEMLVSYNDASRTASISMPGSFVSRGDEMTTLSAAKKYAATTQYFTYNGYSVYPMAYNVTGTRDVAGSNYVMLRDIASLLNFGVTYTNGTIYVSTASTYTPGK